MPQESVGPSPAPATLADDDLLAPDTAVEVQSSETAGQRRIATPIAVSNPRHAQASPSHRTPLLYRDGHDDGDGGGRSGGGGADQRAAAAPSLAPLDAMVQSLLRCGAAADGGIVTASVIVSACPDDAACFAMGGDEGSDKHHRNPLLTRAALDRAMNEHGVSVLGPAESATVLPWAVEGEDHSTHILAVPDIPADLNELHSTGLWWEGERFRGIRPFMAFCEGWVTSWWYGAFLAALWFVQIGTLLIHPHREHATRSVTAQRPEAYSVVLAVQTAAVALMLPFMRWSMVRRCLGFDFGVILLLLFAINALTVLGYARPAGGLQGVSAAQVLLRGVLVSFIVLLPMLSDALRFSPASVFNVRIPGRRVVVSPKVLHIGHVAIASAYYAVVQTLVRQDDHVSLTYDYLSADLTALGAFVDFTNAVFAAKVALRSRNGGLGAWSLPWRVYRLQASSGVIAFPGCGASTTASVVHLTLHVPADKMWTSDHLVDCKTQQPLSSVPAAQLGESAQGPDTRGGDAEPLMGGRVAASDIMASRRATRLVVPPALELFETAPLCRLPQRITRNVVENRRFANTVTAVTSACIGVIQIVHCAVVFTADGIWFHRFGVIPKAVDSAACVCAIVLVPRHAVRISVRSFDFWVMLWWCVTLAVMDVWVEYIRSSKAAFDVLATAIIPIWLAATFAFSVMFLDHHPRFKAGHRTVVASVLALGCISYATMHQFALLRTTREDGPPPKLVIILFMDYGISISTMAQGARLLLLMLLLKYAYRHWTAPQGHSRFVGLRCAVREVPVSVMR